ncbi:MAG: efflux RND transporter periplasmic adaptor subunit [Candidatus Moraniibacteriota bacterium]|jgi:RND family efflux transporter MFP subunit
MKNIIFGCIGIFILSVIVLGFAKKQAQIKSEDIQNITVVQASVEEAFNHENFGGLVSNSSEAVLSAQIGGNINNVFVVEGDSVKKGQVLASISSPELNAQYSGAQSQLQIAIEEEKKARRKWDDFKPEEREQFKLQVDGAQATSNQAAAILAKSRLVAPFDGVVSQVFIKNGDTVMTGSQIVYIVGGENQKEVSVDVPVNIGTVLEIGDQVNVINDDEIYKAKIIAVSPVINSVTRKNLVKIALDENVNIELGVFVSVEFSVGDSSGIRIPKESIIKQYNDTFVFVEKSGVAEMKNVNILTENDENVIIDGISEGENIIVSGAHNIQNGDEIHVVK